MKGLILKGKVFGMQNNDRVKSAFESMMFKFGDPIDARAAMAD